MARFRVIRRSEWGAPRFDGSPAYWTTRLNTLRVHHTAGPRPVYKRGRRAANKAAERELMRTTRMFHMASRGYSDIGYNYVIMPSGRVYEGRGFSVAGAHTLGHNDDPGVCFAGNYELTKPTRRSLIAFWRLRRHLRRRGVRIVRIAPHALTYATACPGKHLRTALRI